MRLEILYVNPHGQNCHEDDPFVEALQKSSEKKIPVRTFSGPRVKECILEYTGDVEESRKFVFVISAFLCPRTEGVKHGRWNPPRDKLLKLLDHKNHKSLRSLRITWGIWRAVRRYGRIFVTTGETKQTPRSFHALRSAFCDDWLCRVYGWEDGLRIRDMTKQVLAERRKK